MSKSPDNLASPPASPAHTVTYDSAATHDSAATQSDDEESRHSPARENQLWEYEANGSQQSATQQLPVEDEDTALQRLEQSGQLVHFTKTLMEKQRDLENTVHCSRELLTQLKKTVDLLTGHLESANSTIRSVDALMSQTQAQSELHGCTSGQGDCNNAGSSSDSARSKRQRH